MDPIIKTPSRKKRIASVLLVTLVLTLTLILIGLPTLFSSSFGKNRLLNYVNKQIPGTLEVQSFQFNWLGSQVIDGLTLKDEQQAVVGTLAKIETNLSLVDLLWHRKGLTDLHLADLHAEIKQDASGISNLQRALGETSPINPLLATLPFDIEVQNVFLDYSFKHQQSPITLKLSGYTKEKDAKEVQRGSFKVEALLSELCAAGCQKIEVNIEQFPTQLIDQLIALHSPEWNGLLQALLGNSCSMTINQHKKEQSSLNQKEQSSSLALHLQSPQAETTLMGELKADGFTLSQPAKLQLTIDPHLYQKFIPVTSSLNQPTPVTIDLLSLSLPFNHPLDTHFQAQVFSEAIQMKGFKDFSALNLLIHKDEKGTTVDLQTKTEHQQTPLSLKIQALIDANLANYQATLRLDPLLNPLTLDSTPTIGQIALQEVKVQLSGPCDYTQCDCIQQTQLQVNLTAVPLLKNEFFNQPTNVKLFLQLKPKLDSTFFKVIGSLLMDELIVGTAADRLATLKEVAIPFEIDLEKNLIELELAGKTFISKENHAGFLKGKIQLTDWLKSSMNPGLNQAANSDLNPGQQIIEWQTAKVNGQLALKKFPLTLVAALVDNPQVTTLLGSFVDLDIQTLKDDSLGAIDQLAISLQGEGWTGKADLSLGTHITLKTTTRPATLDYQLTPQRFALLRHLFVKNAKDQAIVLNESANLTLNIKSLKIPYHQELGWQREAFIADFFVDQLSIIDKNSDRYLKVEKIAGHLTTEDFQKKMLFKLDMQQKEGLSQVNHLHFAGNLQQPFKADGSWNTDKMSLKFEAKAAHLPATLFCDLLGLEETARLKLEALFGHYVAVDIDAHLQEMNGPLKAHIRSKNGSLFLDGKVTDGYLILNQPLVVEVTASQQLSEQVLQLIVPPLGGMTNADDRLRITIDPADFYTPLQHLTMENTQIQRMKIELSRAYFTLHGQMATILSALKDNPTTDSQGLISVWFTPIYLGLHQGVVHIARFDMLAMERYPLAAWGKVDFKRDQIDMSIGLSGKSLQHALGLGISMPDRKHMMIFPFNGPIGHASIDKKKLAAKLAAITAQVAGGPPGLVLGTLFGLATGGFNMNSIPEPTTDPLPWATEAEIEEEHKPNNPFRALKKGASSLLQTIIK